MLVLTVPPFLMSNLAATDTPGFRPFTPTHGAAVAGCAAVIAAVAWIGIYARHARGAAAERRWRRGFGGFALGVFVFSTVWNLLPGNFDWESALPLQFCDLGLLVAGGVLLGGARWLRGLLYFWGTVFTLQAFATPVLQAGPATVTFWLFWTAHTTITGAAVYDLAVGKFRPTFADAARSYLISIFYAVGLLALDNLTGWNYGYVGPAKPGTPTLLDALGEYPLRLLWMLLLVAAGYALAWAPWAKKRSRGAEALRHLGTQN